MGILIVKTNLYRTVASETGSIPRVVVEGLSGVNGTTDSVLTIVVSKPAVFVMNQFGLLSV